MIVDLRRLEENRGRESAEGIVLEDGPDGTRWKRAS